MLASRACLLGWLSVLSCGLYDDPLPRYATAKQTYAMAGAAILRPL
jgi:hypothetical protein